MKYRDPVEVIAQNAGTTTNVVNHLISARRDGATVETVVAVMETLDRLGWDTPPNLRTIAHRLRVSYPTVHGALRPTKSSHVSPETRDKVLAEAARVGWLV